MTVIIDADYREKTETGHFAGILAETPLDAQPAGIVTGVADHVEAYQPGQFYRRELQCVEAVLRRLEGRTIDLILVDGYADFGTDRASLGTHVFDEYRIPVIGVAKNPFRGCLLPDTEVFRGGSRKPLFVTCRGIDPEQAKQIVRSMAGPYRIPDLIKLADQYARDWTR